MLQLLSALRHKCAIGFVGGSDLVKQQEQLGTPSISVTGLFDYCFAENGLTAIRLGQPLASNSFIGWLGQEKYQQLVNFCLRYIADIKCPVKTGTFVEFRYVFGISPAQALSSIGCVGVESCYQLAASLRGGRWARRSVLPLVRVLTRYTSKETA